MQQKSLHILCWICLAFWLASCQTAGEIITPSPTFTLVPPSDTPVAPFFDPIPSQTNAAWPTETAEPTSTITLTPEPTHTPTLEPGAAQVSSVDGVVLIYIPAGEFLMGSTDVDPGADNDEKPQHPVYLSAYWIDQTVVTNAMYAAFLNEMGNQTDGRTTWLDAGDEDVLLIQSDGKWHPKKGYDSYPVVEVTWYGAQAYCQWAGRDLPTETEWEKAARDATEHIYPWGNEIDCEHAQYANCGGGLLPANAKPAGASPYGVLGLSGNVWEWVADWYANDYYATSPRENPLGPEEGKSRVLRGGSWEYDWKHVRSANRRNNGPAVSMHDYGFRCVLR